MAKLGIYAAALAMCALPAAADAALTVKIGNFQNDVVVTFSGAFNTTGLDLLSDDESPFLPNSSLGTSLFRVGGDATMIWFAGLTGPSAFGTTDFFLDGTGAGAAFGLSAFEDTTYVGVANTYTGAPISGGSVFRNTSVSALGLTCGNYSFSSRADSINVNVCAADAGPVPEPSTWALMLAGFAMVGGAIRYRRRSARVRFA